MNRPLDSPNQQAPLDADPRIQSLPETTRHLQEQVQRLAVENQGLRESEEQYRMIFQQAAAGFAHVDLEGHFLNVNQKLCDMLGYSREELLRRRWADVTAPTSLAENLEGRDRMLRGEMSTYVADKQYIRKDGQPIWVHLTVSLVRMPEGQAKYFVTVVQDITQRKREQELLYKSQQQLRSILDYTTAFVYIKDASGRYELINRLFERLFEKTREEVIGRTDFDIFPEELARRYRENDMRVLQLQKPLELEEVAQLRDGLHTYISVKVPILDAQGRSLAVCGISTDITERKHVEAEMLRAKEAAEQANQTKSQFLANISHEIRTPIMALLAAAEMMRGGGLSREQVAEHSEVVLRSGRHLLSLVDDLFDQSRIDSGRLEVVRETCRLPELMADVYAVTAPLLRKPVNLIFQYDTDVPEHLTTDRKRLTQAVINLVHNAIKFTQHGHIHVHVSAKFEQQVPFLVITVEDTGEGIAPADVNKIFEPFTQLDAGRQHAFGGMGLGLALARSIAVRLDGSLDVRSELGKGSTFRLRVPVGPLEERPWVSREVASQWGLLSRNDKSPSISLRGKVLLAEDADDVRRLMSEALRGAGAEVLDVPDGHLAVVAVQSGSFDLVLLDVRMPLVDGLEAAKRIRSMGYAGPMIALTASTTATEHERILTAGFDDLWPKPLSLQHLITLCSAYLQGDPQTSRDSTIVRKMDQIRGDYVRKLEGVIRSLRTALEQQDFDKAGDVLHRLVGSSGVMGFSELATQAARLYELCKAGELDVGSAVYSRFEHLAQRVVDSHSENRPV